MAKNEDEILHEELTGDDSDSVFEEGRRLVAQYPDKHIIVVDTQDGKTEIVARPKE